MWRTLLLVLYLPPLILCIIHLPAFSPSLSHSSSPSPASFPLPPFSPLPHKWESDGLIWQFVYAYKTSGPCSLASRSWSLFLGHEFVSAVPFGQRIPSLGQREYYSRLGDDSSYACASARKAMRTCKKGKKCLLRFLRHLRKGPCALGRLCPPVAASTAPLHSAGRSVSAAEARPVEARREMKQGESR